MRAPAREDETPLMFLVQLKGVICCRCLTGLTPSKAKFHRLRCKTDLMTGKVNSVGHAFGTWARQE